LSAATAAVEIGLVLALVGARTGAAESVEHTPFALWRQSGGTFTRPSFGVVVHNRAGSVAGNLVIEGLQGGDSFIKRADFLRRRFVLLAPGGCFRGVQPPNRAVHPYFGGDDGALPLSFDLLRRSTFAAYVVTLDGERVGCGFHAGRARLGANVWPARSLGRATARGGKRSFFSRQASVTLIPAAGGRRTLVVARTDAGGSNGVLSHIRPGTCRSVHAGLELPMLMSTKEAGVAGTAHGRATLPIRYASFSRHAFAFEVHDDVIGVDVAYCIDLR
jgi:hypothetical protein